MDQFETSSDSTGASEAYLRDRLADADCARANNGIILRHLLHGDDGSIFSDRIVAGVRGMLGDVARQLVIALADAAGQTDPQGWAHRASDALAIALVESPAFLAHLHALAVEWQIAEQLQARQGVDPVISPLLQERIGAQDGKSAAAAMRLLAAQARFGQSQRRMQLPLGELPADLFDIILAAMHKVVGVGGDANDYAVIAERALRTSYDEALGRLGLLRSVISAMNQDTGSALQIEKAGAALFLTAVAHLTAQPRETVVMAMTDGQMHRLALSLRAAGLSAHQITQQLLQLHPEARALDAPLEISTDVASRLLSATAGA